MPVIRLIVPARAARCGFARLAVLLACLIVLAPRLTAGEPTPPKATPKPVVVDIKPDPNDNEVEKKKPLDEILVLVNGIPIYSHSLNEIIDAHVKAAQKPPDAIGMRNARRTEVQNLVHIELIRQFIKANSIMADDAKFKEYLDFLNKEATSRYGEPLQAVLRRNGTDYSQWYKVQKYIFMLRDFAAQQVSDETLDAYIRQHQDSMPLRRVRHILVAYDKSLKNAIPGRTRDQALAKAKDLVERLKKGENFAELAMAEGDSPEALDGGLLPFLERKPKDQAMELAKPFVEAAYQLQKVGDYTVEPVETPYGFHILQLVDIRRDTPNPLHPYSNLRKYVMNTPEYYNDLVEVKWQEMIDTARARSTVQYFGEFEDLNEKPKTPGAGAPGEKSANDNGAPANTAAPNGNLPPAGNGANILPPKNN